MRFTIFHVVNVTLVVLIADLAVGMVDIWDRLSDLAIVLG
jgi:hypothetical protein